MLRMRFYNRKKPKNIFAELKFWINRSIAMLAIILFCFVFLLSAASNADAAGAYSNQVIYNPEFQTSDSTLLSYRKSIEQSDKDTFRITLEAVTGQDIKTIGGKSGSIVLVLDNSGSMGWGSSPTPADYARDALKEFANEFLKNGNSGNKLGLVTYSSGSGVPIYDAYDEIKYVQGYSMTENSDIFGQVVDGLQTPSGETDVQMGIKTARDILAADTSGNPQFILVFSDGATNRSARPTSAGELGGANISPCTFGDKIYDMTFKFDGFDYGAQGSAVYNDGVYTTNGNVNAHTVAAVSEALLAKDQGIDIYSVFYHNPALNDLEYGAGVFVMKNSASSGQYTEISPGNASAFAEIFTEIEKQIQESIAPWFVEDPMADYIEFAGFADEQTSSEAFFDADTGVLKWNLREVNGTPEEAGRFRYKLSYNVFLKSDDEGFENETDYPTNGKTTLTYQKITGEITESNTVDFEVPIVRGDSSNMNLIHVKALDMIAYQEGNSTSGDPFPRPYFAFFWDDNGQPGKELTSEELNVLNYTIDGQPFEEGSHTFFIYPYPFRSQYVNEQTGIVHNDPRALDEAPGIYQIKLTTQDFETAHHYTVNAFDTQGKQYDFRLSQEGRLEVREQSETPTQYTPYTAGPLPENFESATPAVFVEAEAQLYNTAGILLNASQIANVTLMSDGVLPDEANGIASILSQRADMENKTYEMKYLQLVDNEDGNIVVESNKDVIIFYPYPQGMNHNDDFMVFHFYETNRAAGEAPVYTSSGPLAITKLTGGIQFTTNGSMEGFGPFVVAYSKANNGVSAELPEAGGPGNAVFAAVGILMSIAGIGMVLLILKNKKVI